MALFDSDFLSKLEYLSLVSKRVFRGQLLAQRRTKQLGAGVEFSEHREYTTGDDLRYLDWSVLARHDELLLKRFQEEQDLHVYLFLDCSQSMRFGEPQKFDYARQITAALAYIALADLDRVSINAFAGEILATYPLTRGKDCVLSLLSFLEELEPVGQDTNLERCATDFVHRQSRSGLAIVVSDLMDPHGYREGLDRLRFHRFEPYLVHLYHQNEANPQLRGDVELVDAETRERKKVTVNERGLARYRQVFQQFLESSQDYAARYGMGYVQSSTELPFDELVLRMMRHSGTVS
ncbi:MAG: DUF58 domain-containing protein [Pirellulaceae bacterium]|nr:DUF58 domain-containing protein [Pirellulaceae bacterium]